jgi:hypothetical protein
LMLDYVQAHPHCGPGRGCLLYIIYINKPTIAVWPRIVKAAVFLK